MQDSLMNNLDNSRAASRRGASTRMIHVVLTAVSLATLFPFLLIVSASVSNETRLFVEGFSLLPKGFDLTAYRFLFDKPQRILNAYWITIALTSVGTALSLLFMSMLAYAVSRPEFKYRKFFNIYILIPMLFNGGLVPYYILVTQYLKLTNTFLVLLIPQLIGLYQVILLRVYFSQLPEELFDAARIDGASEWRVFGSMAMPLAKPALVTVGLMIGIAYWNNWTTALYFIRDWKLYPLQYLLYQVMRDSEILALEPQIGAVMMPFQTSRMAMAVIATGPAAIAFLFLQKHMVRGITFGSLK